jgi:hypothetical protein
MLTTVRGKAKEWSKVIYEPLRSIGSDPPFGYHVRAKSLEEFLADAKGKKSKIRPEPGEVHLIDFVYSQGCDQKQLWHPPLVVIEHENRTCRRYQKGKHAGKVRRLDDLKRDFWKACLYAVPLRVVIGYGRDLGGSDDRQVAYEGGVEIARFYELWQLRQLPHGETLLVMGWPQDAGEREWWFWIKAANEPWRTGFVRCKAGEASLTFTNQATD